MTPETLTAIENLLKLGWPAIVTLACWILWRKNQYLSDVLLKTHSKRDAELFQSLLALQNEYISTLKEVAGLRASLAQKATERPSVAIERGVLT